jgi:hypothetical protein
LTGELKRAIPMDQERARKKTYCFSIREWSGGSSVDSLTNRASRLANSSGSYRTNRRGTRENNTAILQSKSYSIKRLSWLHAHKLNVRNEHRPPISFRKMWWDWTWQYDFVEMTSLLQNEFACSRARW